MTDFIAHNEGSLIGLTPNSEIASEWLEENTAAEPWQFMGPTLWIDHRCAIDVMYGILDAGLSIEDGATGRIASQENEDD